MPNEFTHDIFLSHSAKDKQAVRVPNVVRPLAERLQVAVRKHLKVWFDEWKIPVASVCDRQGRRSQSAATAAKIEEGLEHSRVLVLCMSAQAFGSDWAQLEACSCGRGNLPFRDPMNRERRFIPLRLDDTRIKGSLAQFICMNWRPAQRRRAYALGNGNQPVAAETRKLRPKGLGSLNKMTNCP